MLQAGIETRLTLRQSNILPLSYRQSQAKGFFQVYIYSENEKLLKTN